MSTSLFICALLLLCCEMVNSVGLIKRTKLGKLSNSVMSPPPLPKGAALPPDEWFSQKLDHFDPTTSSKWKQRYFVNASFFKPDSTRPVFLMLGGEGEASAHWMVTGAWMIYAKKYGALCFLLEHRFYGKSRPTDDMDVSNLKYLSSEQALADVAYFIKAMKHNFMLTASNKWIVFGGSYPGSLAAWARSKYPHLIHGAMSSSGPLLAKVDFRAYFGVVRSSLKTSKHGNKCVKCVSDANKYLRLLMKSDTGVKKIFEDFKLCDALDVQVQTDMRTLYEVLADNFAGVVQYNKDNRIGGESNITIDVVCDIMENVSLGTPVERYAAINNLFLLRDKQNCTEFKYDDAIASLRNTSWESEAANGGRQWTYQTCTEFGFYQTSSNDNDLFGKEFPISYFIQQCADIYGERFTKKLLEDGVYRTNALYGGLDISVSRVVFVHGTIDPWHALGITKTKHPNSPAIYIAGTAHCANMYPPSKHDPPSLKKAREQISVLIGNWLKETNKA